MSKAANVPRIIIGAETEYGLFVTLGDGAVADTRFDRSAHYVVEEARHIFPELFQETKKGIRDDAEHEKAEQALANLRRQLEKNGMKVDADIEAFLVRRIEDAALLQRLGYSGSMLPNGARYYVDMGHPEYSIPETDNPLDALCAQKKGDIIVAECRKRAEARLRREQHDDALTVRIDKNNSDGHGESYAGHENYSTSPRLFTALINGTVEACATMLFFAARQIITGAGKIGSEGLYPGECPYQISQRADFIHQLRGRDTTGDFRALINTRDRPYADPSLFRRFHVIVGDSNLSQISLYLKFGISALFFMMLDSGFLLRNGSDFLFTPVRNPARAFRDISRDPTLRYRFSFIGGGKKTAHEVMCDLLAYAKKFVRLSGLSGEWERVLRLWEGALTGLADGREKNEISRSLDWVAKKRLLDSVIRRKNLRIADALPVAMALEYHNIDETRSLFKRMEKAGEIQTLVTDENIAASLREPPRTTRAWLRGEMVRRYGTNLLRGNWDTFLFRDDGDGATFLSLGNPHCGGKEESHRLFDGDPAFSEFIERLGKAAMCGVTIKRDRRTEREGTTPQEEKEPCASSRVSFFDPYSIGEDYYL